MNEQSPLEKQRKSNPLRLVDDSTLREIMLEWVRGTHPDIICEKHKITRIQYHRQTYYYKRQVLADITQKVFEMRDQDMNSVQIGKELDIPFETINKIIAREILL